MPKAVLDASALLALLHREIGADLVEAAMSDAVMSAINLSEVVAKLAEAGMEEWAIREALGLLRLEIAPFDRAQAYEAGLMRPATRGVGASLGDRACLSLAKRLGLTAITADRKWRRLSIGVAVQVIR